MGAPTDKERRRVMVLPDHLANMIAAGEVVERPSSVVKELVENSLDAGAGEVGVDLTAGGKALVTITDDGSGMDGDDAVLAFERHATSKLATPDELNRIGSFGFRGEALPSIASVSRVSLQTCPDDGGIGTEVIIDGGQLRTVREVGRARGTTISVRSLFYNTPARRKFLRKEVTELRHVSRELTGLALGRPDVGFRLAHAGREILECRRVTTWQERVQSLFGKEMLQRGVELDGATPGIHVYGLLGAPGDAGTYPEQHILVNARAVQSRVLRRALGEGYEATEAGGAKPFFVIFLDVDPALVDVNVHPQKKEIRFRDDHEVFALVKESVRESFAKSRPTGRPSPAPLPLGPDEPAAQDAPKSDGIGSFWYDSPEKRTTGAGRVADSDVPVAERPPYRPPARPSTPPTHAGGQGAAPLHGPAGEPRAEQKGAAHEPGAPKKGAETSQLNLHLVSPEGGGRPPAAAPERGEEAAQAQHIWQFQNKYIFVSTRDGLWIIDQHVAHERILFEEAMQAFAGEDTTAQRLLFPVTVELSPEQDAVFDEVMPMLESMGFGLQRLSGRSVMIDAYPSSARTTDDGALVRQLIQDIQELGFKRTGIREQLATVYSCHAAIKAGDPLDKPRMQWLIERLFATSMPYVCPHGRPTIVKIAMSELDNRFGRS